MKKYPYFAKTVRFKLEIECEPVLRPFSCTKLLNLRVKFTKKISKIESFWGFPLCSYKGYPKLNISSCLEKSDPRESDPGSFNQHLSKRTRHYAGDSKTDRQRSNNISMGAWRVNENLKLSGVTMDTEPELMVGFNSQKMNLVLPDTRRKHEVQEKTKVGSKDNATVGSNLFLITTI